MWSRNQNAACLAGWAVSVGNERGLAGESGVAAPALPPQSKTRWLQPVLPWADDTMCRGLATANSLRFDGLRRFPVSSNQFQSLLKKLCGVEIKTQHVWRGGRSLLAVSVGWQAKAVVLAYGHQPPQSKTRWLQPVLPWEGDTMYRGLATANSMRFDELRRFPVSSNQFQSILKKLCGAEIKTQHVWRGGQLLSTASAGWQAKAVSPLALCHRSPRHAGCSRCCLGQAT